MTKLPLEPFGSAADDLFFWVKQYLGNKIFSLMIDRDYENSFDHNFNEQRIIDAKDDFELENITREIRRNGMKNLGIYSVGVVTFYRYVKADKKIESIKEIDTSFRDKYFATNPSGLSSGTLHSYFIQANSLFKFIEEYNLEEHKFNLGVTRGGRRTTSPIVQEDVERSYLLPEELERFLVTLETFKYRHENPAQIRLLMKLVCFGGLKTDEVVSLKTSQITTVKNPSPLLPKDDFYRIEIIGKAKKLRMVFIKVALIEKDLNECLNYRTCAKGLLFCNQDGERYSNRTPYDQANRLFKAAGLDRTGMHTLRRSYATYLMAKSVDFAVISELLGHEDEEVTGLYVQITKDGLCKIVKYWQDI